MTAKPMTTITTTTASGERLLRIGKTVLPLAIASVCADPKISGHIVECTECRERHPVRDLNEGGYCEDCACEDLLD